MSQLSNVIGFDDAPFPAGHRGDVSLIGTVCSRTRLDVVLRDKVRRDGANSTAKMVQLVRESGRTEHVQAVLLQGIAVAGFNVVDIHALHEELGIPVLVVARRNPRMNRVFAALNKVPGGARKRRLIEAAGPMERVEAPKRGPRRSAVYVQRVGLSPREAAALLRVTTLHGNLPEPLRLAHLIAGGITTGVSRGRA